MFVLLYHAQELTLHVLDRKWTRKGGLVVFRCCSDAVCLGRVTHDTGLVAADGLRVESCRSCIVWFDVN